MRIRMLVHLSGTEEATMLPGVEYEVAAHVAARYYDHGIADIVEPGWEARPRLGTDEERRDRGEEPIDYRPWDDVIASLNPVAAFRFDVADEGLALKPGQVAEISSDGTARVLSDEEAAAVTFPEGPLEPSPPAPLPVPEERGDEPATDTEKPAADAGMTTESAAPAVPAEKPKRARSPKA